MPCLGGGQELPSASHRHFQMALPVQTPLQTANQGSPSHLDSHVFNKESQLQEEETLQGTWLEMHSWKEALQGSRGITLRDQSPWETHAEAGKFLRDNSPWKTPARE